MKNQMVELVFYVEHYNDQIGIYRVKKKGKWVFNIVVQDMELLTAKGKRKRTTLFSNFKDLNTYRTIQNDDEWIDKFQFAFDRVEEFTNFQWLIM